MINIKQLVKIFLFYCFVFLFIGCTGLQRETKSDMQGFLNLVTPFIQLKSGLSEDLEKKAGFKFSQVAFINSETGEKKFMIHDQFELSADEKVTEINDITPISVIGVSGITIGKKTYESCNYVSYAEKTKLQTKLICKRGANQPSPEDPVDTTIESFPTELATDIENASGINNVGFLLFSNYKTGELKIVKNKDYIVFDGHLPNQSVSAINNGISWSVTTYKRNPCCTTIMVGTEKQKVCSNSTLSCYR
ncbi:MAG: hypothetical protein DU481_15400 [Nitrosomonas sp.]|uniref:hypothetical protein n=1 Tax=Nitrosomonas sp. TaxID=42353 RepID=UPI0032EBFE04